MPEQTRRRAVSLARAAGFVAPVAALFLAVSAVPAPPSTGKGGPAANSSRSVFERRILPLLQAKQPSTCAECHLSGVDLKDYLRPTEAETFAALRDQGLIDLKRPEGSRLLRLIEMSRPNTPLLTKQARQVEYAAVRDWIMAAAANPKLRALPAKPVSTRVGPAVPDAVVRHERIDAVVASFERNVWSQEGRCMGCHRPDNAENVKKYGERVRWFVPDSPEATMRRLIAQGDVNVQKPEESLLLLKPLNKVPHGGGVKMLYGDAGYKLFRTWLEDYAASVHGTYRSASDLPLAPKQALVNANSVLTVNGTPAAWFDKLLRVDAYPWDEAKGAWAMRPVITGDRMVYASNNGEGGSTNLILFRIVPAADAATQKALPPLSTGRYLLKFYCDTEGRLKTDYRLPTDSPDLYRGQQEVTAEWGKGWGGPVVVRLSLPTSTVSTSGAGNP
jgi:hypothetical protein